MRRFAWRSLALINLIAFPACARGETRPHYGGTLTLEVHEALTFADPGDWPPELVALVYDSLVRLDERGEARPALAVSWQHDPEFKRWEFALRPGVKFHDGSPVNAAAVAASLKSSVSVTPSGEGVIAIQTDSPAPDLPVRLAGPRYAVLRRGANAMTSGSGPFRIAEWQPGKRARLAANDDYWGGRPFVDAVELSMGRAYRDQSIDLELGKTDVAELAIEDARRGVERGLRTWTSAPVELLALVFERGRASVEDARLRQAVALAIDRAAIHGVLLQRQGELSGALLPQWLTGYAFLFPTARDLDRSRDRVALIQPVPRVALSYDPGDPLARLLAERIALNAREAGVVLQVAPGGKADVRLARVRLSSLDAAQALADLAAVFGIPWQAPSGGAPEVLFPAEQKLLDDYRVVPLFHVPQILGLSPRLRNWDPLPWGDWRLENVWLEPRRP
jgi:MarR-like DNA-binding transcriptional regulator SgrR of sgrS sRNA